MRECRTSKSSVEAGKPRNFCKRLWILCPSGLSSKQPAGIPTVCSHFISNYTVYKPHLESQSLLSILRRLSRWVSLSKIKSPVGNLLETNLKLEFSLSVHWGSFISHYFIPRLLHLCMLLLTQRRTIHLRMNRCSPMCATDKYRRQSQLPERERERSIGFSITDNEGTP